jgi:hypothetical protein
MSHSFEENIVLSVYSYETAKRVLQDIFRACKGEYTINWDETDSTTENALGWLYERKLIEARPVMPRAPYHMAPSELAHELFALWAEGFEVREPRDADRGILGWR